MLAKFVVFSGILAVVLSATLNEPVPIVAQSDEVHPDGSFQWSYQSGDGTAQQQTGQLVGKGDEAGEAIQGSASWTDKEGGQHQLQYVADENGYQPQGADIPLAPEIPAAIQRSLQWNAAHPEEEKQI